MEPPRAADFIAPTDERNVPSLSATQYNDPSVSDNETRLTDRVTELLVTLTIAMEVTRGTTFVTVGDDVGNSNAVGNSVGFRLGSDII